MHTFIESELLGTAVVNLPVAADEGKGGSLTSQHVKLLSHLTLHTAALQFHYDELFQVSSNHLFACQCQPFSGGGIRVHAAV